MKKRPNLLNAIAVSCSLFLLLVPTSLWVIGESGPGVQAQQIAIKVTQPEALNFAWSTDQAGAVGGTWKVTTTNFVTGQVNTVAMGQATPVPPPGEQGSFTIPANSFLQATPPATPVTYSATITPYNATNQPLGSPSPAVTITQIPPTPPVVLSSAIYPSIELIHYQERRTSFFRERNSSLRMRQSRCAPSMKATPRPIQLPSQSRTSML